MRTIDEAGEARTQSEKYNEIRVLLDAHCAQTILKVRAAANDDDNRRTMLAWLAAGMRTGAKLLPADCYLRAGNQGSQRMAANNRPACAHRT